MRSNTTFDNISKTILTDLCIDDLAGDDTPAGLHYRRWMAPPPVPQVCRPDRTWRRSWPGRTASRPTSPGATTPTDSSASHEYV